MSSNVRVFDTARANGFRLFQVRSWDVGADNFRSSLYRCRSALEEFCLEPDNTHTERELLRSFTALGRDFEVLRAFIQDGDIVEGPQRRVNHGSAFEEIESQYLKIMEDLQTVMNERFPHQPGDARELRRLTFHQDTAKPAFSWEDGLRKFNNATVLADTVFMINNNNNPSENVRNLAENAHAILSEAYGELERFMAGRTRILGIEMQGRYGAEFYKVKESFLTSKKKLESILGAHDASAAPASPDLE